MFVQVLKWSSLMTFLNVQLIASNQVLANTGPQPPPPIASTNVSIVSAGSAFTMKCQIPDNYTIGNEQFDMYFGYDTTGIFASFEIPGEQITAN